MASSTAAKQQLKQAKLAVGKKDYAAVHKHATQVLEYEPLNYNAYARFIASEPVIDYDVDMCSWVLQILN